MKKLNNLVNHLYKKVFLFLLFTLHLTLYTVIFTPVYAAFSDNNYSARINSLSGAFTALADNSDTVFMQPAGLSNIRELQGSFTYGRMFMGLDDGSNITSPVISLGLPAYKKISLGFGYKSINLDNIYNETTIILGGAYKFNKMLSLGLSAKSLGLKYGTDEYTAIDPLLLKNKNVSTFDMDMGVFLRPIEHINIGYSRQNLQRANIGLAENIKITGTERIGIAYTEDMFRAVFESLNQDNKVSYLCGVEKNMLNNLFALRFGFAWGDNEFGKLTGGFGFNFNDMSLDYSIDYPFKTIEHAGTHYVTLNIKFVKPSKSDNVINKPEVKKIDKKQLMKERLQKIQIKKPEIEKPHKIVAFSTKTLDQSFPEPVQAKSTGSKVPLLWFTDPLKAFPFEKELVPVPVNDIEKSLIPAVTIQPSVPVQEAPRLEAVDAPPAPVIIPVPVVVPVSVPKKQLRTKTIKKPQIPKEISNESDKQALFKKHTVASGETLPMIAKKYYGKESSWVKIYEANKDNIEKGSLREGQVLIIP